MTEYQWNWPLIVIFIAFFGGMLLWMSLPEGVVITETCTTVDNITKCVSVESYK